jgi:predicted Zn-dependent peptidase
MNYKKTQLDNGMRILSEMHPHSRCLVTGLWVETGTRFEEPKQVGISHLLEHMVFKGTDKYTTYELARCLEAKGGDVNAFTAREHTCFHTSSLKEDLDLSIDVLAQLTAFAKFDQNEFIKEKKVVQQEILMAADELEEFAFDLYFEKIFANNSLGYQILGSVDSVDAITRDQVVAYYDKHFVPENMIVTATGFVDHDELVEKVQEHFKNKKWLNKKQETQLIAPPRLTINEFFKKDSEQYHIIVGFPACSYSDPSRFNGYVVNTALGGGMTSKLYQKIREDRGLVYSVFSILNTFIDTGIQTIYAGTEKKHVEEVVDLIYKELKLIHKNGLTKDDINLFKTQAKGQIVIGSDDIDNRMNSLAVNEMVFKKFRSVDEVISDIEKVNQDSVMEYIEDKLDPENLSLFLLGEEPLKTVIHKK